MFWNCFPFQEGHYLIWITDLNLFKTNYFSETVRVMLLNRRWFGFVVALFHFFFNSLYIVIFFFFFLSIYSSFFFIIRGPSEPSKVPGPPHCMGVSPLSPPPSLAVAEKYLLSKLVLCENECCKSWSVYIWVLILKICKG